MDKYQLISSMIVQVNNAVGLLLSGQYMAWMGEQQDIISKLAVLKDGLKQDDQEYEQTIEAQKKLIEELTAKGMKQDGDD